MNQDRSSDAARLAALADAYGLTALREVDPEVFAAAYEAGRALAARTPRPEHIELEPAHACRFSPRGPRRGAP